MTKLGLLGFVAIAALGLTLAAVNSTGATSAAEIAQGAQDLADSTADEQAATAAAAQAEAAKKIAHVTRPTDRALRVLFTGDSLTGGLSAEVESGAFKWLMLADFEKGGPVEEFNSAISGGTTVEVADQFDVPEGLDMAVVELGTNDHNNRTPLAEFEAAYVGLLDRITAGSPGVPLVCAGIWEVQLAESSPPYNAVIESACTAHGGQFVALTDIYNNPDNIGPAGTPTFNGVTDPFHPNNEGHAAIAGALLARISIT